MYCSTIVSAYSIRNLIIIYVSLELLVHMTLIVTFDKNSRIIEKHIDQIISKIFK